MIAPNGGYTVRTLYFDTYDYRAYQEKVNGDHDRIKFRLRTYSREISRNADIRAEMKVRKGNAMEKHGVLVSPESYSFFMKKKRWPDNNEPVLQEFERYTHLWGLKPQVLIEYLREGFQDRERSGIRITFDRKVRGTPSDCLFPPIPVYFRDFQPHTFIMEIKCKDNHPVWLRNLVRNHGLKWVANSKFTHGIQSARPDLIYPSGIVVVR